MVNSQETNLRKQLAGSIEDIEKDLELKEMGGFMPGIPSFTVQISPEERTFLSFGFCEGQLFLSGNNPVDGKPNYCSSLAEAIGEGSLSFAILLEIFRTIPAMLREFLLQQEDEDLRKCKLPLCEKMEKIIVKIKEQE